MFCDAAADFAPVVRLSRSPLTLSVRAGDLISQRGGGPGKLANPAGALHCCVWVRQRIQRHFPLWCAAMSELTGPQFVIEGGAKGLRAEAHAV